MPKSIFDQGKVAIPCPNCGHKTEKTVQWLKARNKFTCAECSRIVEVDRDQFLAEIKRADQALAEFRESLGKFGKRR